MANKAVFLDRDNTLIHDPGYLSDPDAVRLLPGVELALKSLADAGYRLIVVTNQSAIARGLVTEATLEKIHAELRRQLAEKGAHLDAIYHCPHHPEGTVEEYAIDCDDRKPRPGMLLRAAREHDLDLRQCWMIGDSPRDVGAGQQAGCRTIRIRRPDQQLPPGERDEQYEADYTVRNLVEAGRIIAGNVDDRSPGALRASAGGAGHGGGPAGGPALEPIRRELAELRKEVQRLGADDRSAESPGGRRRMKIARAILTGLVALMAICAIDEGTGWRRMPGGAIAFGLAALAGAVLVLAWKGESLPKIRR